MTLDQMNQDLAKYDDFEQLSDRVSYWRRRLGKYSRREEMTEDFDTVVAKHSNRVLRVFRVL